MKKEAKTIKTKTILTLVIGVILFTSPVYTEGLIDSMGVDWQYGKGKNSHSTNTVNRIAIWADTTVFDDPWALRIEGHLSDHKLNERPDYGQDTGFQEIGGNLILAYNVLKNVRIGVLGGLAYVPEFPGFEGRAHWSINSQIGNIGRSHCLGTFGALAGIKIPVYGKWSLQLHSRYTHSSDPFMPDSGLNYLSGGLGIVYKF